MAQMNRKVKAKKEKPASDFSSGSCKAPLSDFNLFVNNRSHLDFLLDESTRTKVLQQAKDGETNKKIENFFDISRTLARQSIA